MRKFFLILVAAWLIGFAVFSVTLPQPLNGQSYGMKTDAVIVPTGGPGRILRGLEIVRKGQAKAMLVTGVDPEVTPQEFAAEFGVSPQLMECCVTLGFTAVDTRGNAMEAAEWVEMHKVISVRLVTTDWHMRRAANELGKELPANVQIVQDGVPSEPSLGALALEYHKLLYSWAASLWERL